MLGCIYGHLLHLVEVEGRMLNFSKSVNTYTTNSLAAPTNSLATYGVVKSEFTYLLSAFTPWVGKCVQI